MINIALLEEKGFKRVVYKDQVNKPIFYSKKIEIPEKVHELFLHFKEDLSLADFDLTGIYCIIEVSEDFTFSQYLFSEHVIGTGFYTYGEIPIDEFSNVLNQI